MRFFFLNFREIFSRNSSFQHRHGRHAYIYVKNPISFQLRHVFCIAFSMQNCFFEYFVIFNLITHKNKAVLNLHCFLQKYSRKFFQKCLAPALMHRHERHAYNYDKIPISIQVGLVFCITLSMQNYLLEDFVIFNLNI